MPELLERTRPPRTSRDVRRPSVHAGVQSALDWERLEPRGTYARLGRPLFEAALIVLALGPVAVLGLFVALANLVSFRDPRLVFYTQPRVGRRGRVFRIYKFRTMRDVRTSAHASWSSGDESARVTRLGTFLRSTHLDELPQFLNILRGEMTFIGPRPEMVEVEAWASEHVDGFSSRLVLKPGITGRAQITQGYTGRCVEAYAEKLAINRAYLDELSFGADVEILARTVVWMACGRGWSWNRGTVPAVELRRATVREFTRAAASSSDADRADERRRAA